jgi:hypothetical protein
MNHSTVSYPGLSGAQANFGVPFKYLLVEHVHFYVALAQGPFVSALEVFPGLDFDWITSATVAFRAGRVPSSNSSLYIRRVTPGDDFVVHVQGGTLTSSGIETRSLQLLYLMQEAADATQELAALFVGTALSAAFASTVYAGETIGLNGLVNVAPLLGVDTAYLATAANLAKFVTHFAPVAIPIGTYGQVLSLGFIPIPGIITATPEVWLSATDPGGYTVTAPLVGPALFIQPIGTASQGRGIQFNPLLRTPL